MSNDINTNFADDSGPDRDTLNIFRGLGLVAALLSPLTIITAVGTYLTFSYGRVHYKVIGSFVVVYGLLLFVFGLWDNLGWAYLNSFLEPIRLIDDFTWEIAVSVVLTMMMMQAPLSLFIGGIIGTVYSWWAWFRRPVWKKYNFRKTPKQMIKKYRNIKDIRNDKATPPDGRTIGVTEDGDRVNQSEREGRAHTVVMGASGSGKTTTILNGCRDMIKRGESVVFIDMKGSTDVPEVLSMYAKRYGRRFLHWTATETPETYDGPSVNGPAFYDALGRGDATRKANLLLAGRKWEGNADHYKFIIQNYLQKAFEISNATPDLKGPDSFADILGLLDPQTLKKRTLHLTGDARYEAIVEEIHLMADNRMDQGTSTSLSGMRSQYGALAQSVQGRWLKNDPSGKQDINLFDAAHNGDVIVFSIDSSNYEENSRILGNFIIQDLKTVSSELRHNPSRYPLNVIIDEFAAIGSDNIINLINKSRDAKMPVTLSTQSLGDLRTVSNAFMDQLTGIVSSFIIHRANGYDDAEVYAALTPRIQKSVFRQSVSHSTNLFGGIGRGSGTGKGTVDSVDAHMIDPSDIQSLKAGEAFYICKDPERLARVQVYTEAENIASEANDGKANGVYDASQEVAPLMLKDGENLDDYKQTHSENYLRSMAEQEKEDQERSTKQQEASQRRANPAVLKRIIGEEHLRQMSVKGEAFTLGDIEEASSGEDIFVASEDSTEDRPVIKKTRPGVMSEVVKETQAGSGSWSAVPAKPGPKTANVPPKRPAGGSGSWGPAPTKASALPAPSKAKVSDSDTSGSIRSGSSPIQQETVSQNHTSPQVARKEGLGLPDVDFDDDEIREPSKPDFFDND